MLIAGAGGHALEVLDVLNKDTLYSVDELFFYDNTPNAPNKIKEYTILHSKEEVLKLFEKDNLFCLGVGNSSLRNKFVEMFEEIGGKLKQIVANSALISASVKKFQGDSMEKVFISNNSSIAKGVLINTGAQIHHNAEIGAYTQVSPMAVILGNVIVGENCQIGANATILPKVKIGNNSIIGAGSVVIKDVPANSVSVGVPARVIKLIL